MAFDISFGEETDSKPEVYLTTLIDTEPELGPATQLRSRAPLLNIYCNSVNYLLVKEKACDDHHTAWVASLLPPQSTYSL
jgi:hypothetical protein